MQGTGLCFYLLFGFFVLPAFAEDKLVPDPAKRVKLEAKVAIKKNSANLTINDIRQQISGYFLLQDIGSIYDVPVGSLQGKYWIIGQAAGGLNQGASGKYIVFQREAWSQDLPARGSVQIPIKEITTAYDKTGSGKSGYEYFGYLFTIEDREQKAVVVKSNRKDFEENAAAFLSFEPSMTFDKDFEKKQRVAWYR